MNLPEILAGRAVRDLVSELGLRLDAKGVEGRIFVVGGAAMALAFSRDRITRDIDAVFEPTMLIYDEADAMAAEQGLPPGWLNDAVKGMLPDREPPMPGPQSYSVVGLHVGVASADYMFAMKAAAARQETDGADLRLLAPLVGVTTVAEALALVERFYGTDRLSLKTQLVLEDLLGPDA